MSEGTAIVAARCACGWADAITADTPDEPLSTGVAWMLRQVEEHEHEEHERQRAASTADLDARDHHARAADRDDDE